MEHVKRIQERDRERWLVANAALISLVGAVERRVWWA